MQLRDDLRDDAGGVVVLTVLDERDEFVTCGILHQVRPVVVPQEADRPTAIKIAQRHRARLLLRLSCREQFKNDCLVLVGDGVDVTCMRLGEKLRVREVPCGQVVVQIFGVAHGDDYTISMLTRPYAEDPDDVCAPLSALNPTGKAARADEKRDRGQTKFLRPKPGTVFRLAAPGSHRGHRPIDSSMGYLAIKQSARSDGCSGPCAAASNSLATR